MSHIKELSVLLPLSVNGSEVQCVPLPMCTCIHRVHSMAHRPPRIVSVAAGHGRLEEKPLEQTGHVLLPGHHVKQLLVHSFCS